MVYLASDHRGMVRKEEIKKFLDEIKENYQDVGNLIYDPNDDEVDFVNRACEQMEKDFREGRTEVRGIFFCGSGVMVDIAANRFPQIRSCLAINMKQVEMGRKDDDTNVLCLAADFLDNGESKKLVRAFLKTEFSNEEKYVKRIKKLRSSS